MTIAATLWGGYGRWIAKPIPAAIVSVSIVVINIALILGSRMWEVPLATEISKLWIDPASQVASNNALVETYGSKVSAQNNELFTLSQKDGGNMATVTGMDLWYNYSAAVLDTVVRYNGTMYTWLDVCNARLGQSPYNFGCSINSPLDYFSEGKTFWPTDAAAQWILDERTVYAPQSNPIATKANTWTFAALFDAASGGVVSVYTNWFLASCLVTKRLFCTDNTQLIGEVNLILGATLPPTLTPGQRASNKKSKLQLAWAKGQFVVGYMMTFAVQSLQGFCSGSPFDATTGTDTPSNVTFASDPEFALLMTRNNYVPFVASFANCAIDQNGIPCSGVSEPCTGLADVAVFNFSHPCAKCIMAAAYWSGDLWNIQKEVGPYGIPANSVPDASLPGGLLATPNFKFYDPTDPPTAYALYNGYAVDVADDILNNHPACAGGGATQDFAALPVPRLVSASVCDTLWDQFLASNIAAATQNSAGLLAAAKARGIALAFVPNLDPVQPLGLYTFTDGGKTVVDATWREFLKAGGFPPVKDALLRYDSRPSYKNTSDAQIPIILSGFKNDLLTQNLRPAIFGGATPSAGSIRAGRCQCFNSTIAGANCNLKADPICDCDGTLKPTCVGALLGSCLSLAPCAGYTSIVSLIASPYGDAVPSDMANLKNDLLVAAAFTNNSAVAVQTALGVCASAAPCLDAEDWSAPSENFTDLNDLKFSDDWNGILSDATWNLATLGENLTSATKWARRAFILANACNGLTEAGCLGFISASGDLSTFLNDNNFDFGVTEFGVLNSCLTSQTAFGTTCVFSPFAQVISGPTYTDCPDTEDFANLISLTHVTPFILFHCIAEAGQVSGSARLPMTEALWPKGTTNKAPACAAATATINGVPRSSCANVVGGALMQALGTYFLTIAGVDGPTAEATYATFGGTGSDLGGANETLITNLGPLVVGYLASGSTSSASSTAQNLVVGTAFPMCTSVSVSSYSTCPYLASVVDRILDDECESEKDAFDLIVPAPAVEKDGCLVLTGNILGALSSPPNAAAVAAISRSLAKYKFMGTLFGVCASTGGNQYGGAECWIDADCNNNLNATTGLGGLCNMTGSLPLSNVNTLAAIAFTNDGEGTQSQMASPYAKYRQMANAPIFVRYQARQDALAGRRLAPIDFGTLGPVNLTLDDAKKMISEWRVQMQKNIDEFRDANAAVKADAVTADSATNLLNDISSADPKILILGYGLMLLYAFLSCTNWSTDVPAMLNGSRALVAQAGIILVAISVASGLGVSHLLKVEWSAAATQIVPFVMLGLGVSDTFVLLRIFPYYQDGLSAEEACAKALTIAGPPMLLVSATNAGVFAVGVLTAMPVVVNFALQAVIVVIANYFTTNLMLPALLVLDYKRMGAGRMDMAPCVHVGTSPRAQVHSETSEYEINMFNRCLTPMYTKCLLSIPGKIFVICLSIAFLGSAVYGVDKVAELGLQLSDIAPVGSDLANALITRDTNFGFYTINVVTSEADWSRREVQQGLVDVFNNVMATPYVVDGSGTPWIQAFMLWGQIVTPTYDPYAAGQYCDDGSVSNSPNSRTGGACGLRFNCSVIVADDSVVNGKIPFYPASDFYRCLEEWIKVDLTYEALKPGFKLKDEFASRGDRELFYSRNDSANAVPGVSAGLYLPYTTGTLITTGLKDNADFVNVINQVRAVANSDTTPPTFPTGEPIDFWDQYVSLKEIINRAVGYGLLICWLTIWFLLLCLVEGDSSTLKRVFATFWASALTTGIIALTVYEIYGFMAYATLKISAIPAISIIMCTGVAVEYTAYVAVAFVNGAGTLNERAKHSLMLMLAPVIDGAVTMFLGVVMLAASPFLFIVKYFFYPWLFIIFFGMFNGIAFLPVVFSLVGPPAVMSVAGKKTADSNSKELATKM